MKDLLLLCTKNVRCSGDNKLYSQKDGVAMDHLRTSNSGDLYGRFGKDCDTKAINTYN